MTPPDPSISAAELLHHSRWIRRLAAELSSDVSAAEDLVQETWLRALTKPPRNPLDLRAWLGRVLRNLAIDRGREEVLRGKPGAEPHDVAALPATDELVERLDAQRVLVEELLRTPEPYRATILLAYYEDLAPTEIARRQGLPPGTVRWRLKHGLDHLRSRLDERLGEEPGSWVLALAALADPRSAGVRRGLELSSTSLAGAALMSTGTKLSLGVLGLVALGATLWKLDPFGPMLGAAGEVVAPSLQQPPDAKALLAEPSSSDEGSERTGAVVASETEDVDGTVGDESELALTARFIDVDGRPLPGVRLELANPSFQDYGAAASDSDGRAELWIDWSRVENPQMLTWNEQDFLCRATGKASRPLRTLLKEHETVHLGDVTLQPAGEIEGVVVDQDGAPVSDATVFAAPSDYRAYQGLDARGGSVSVASSLEYYACTVPSTRTDATGSFRLDDVAPGHRRVWTGSPDTRYSYSASIEVVAGEVRDGVELVLEALTDEDVIEGVVLDPEGVPRQGAMVQAAFSVDLDSGSRSGSLGAMTDDEGRFRFTLEVDAPHDLTVTDSAQTFAPVFKKAVEPGTPDLVLQFGGGLGFEVLVHDTSGSPIETFKVSTFEIQDEQQSLETRLEKWLWSSSRTETPAGPHEGGRARVAVRSERFDMLVDARGYELLELGPLDLSDLGEPLDCALTPALSLQGRVHAAGRPVQGATIELLGLPAPGRQHTAEDMPCVVDPTPLDWAQSDASGQFSVFCYESGVELIRNASPTSARDGHFRIRATADGFAPAFVEARTGAGVVDVELTPGGSLAGRVLTDQGTNPAGTIVGVTNGDGHPRSTRCSEDGRFRFESLTPGPWYVTRLAEEIGGGVGSTGDGKAKGDLRFPTSCVVVAGEETRYDLDFRGALCELTGRLAIEGVDTSGWLVSLRELDRPNDEARHETATIDAQGGFAASLPRDTRFRLRIRARDPASTVVNDELALDDATVHWEPTLELGELSVAGAPTDGKRLMHRHDSEGELRVFTTLVVDSTGSVAPSAVPAGDGAIVLDVTGNHDEASYAVLATILVKPGELQSVDLAP